MGQVPTAAQRRIIETADPVTGRLRGPAAQLTALVRLGLAFRHPRPPHDSYLTPAGHQWLRAAATPQPAEGAHVAAESAQATEASTAPARPNEAGGEPVRRSPAEGGPLRPAASGPGARRQQLTAPEPGGTVFAARTGAEPGGADDGPERARQVRSAWQGLIELRRMTHPDAATDRPCSWERTHLVRAAALALEAGGCRPAVAGAGGYRVTDTPQPEAVAVHAPTPEDLHACAAVLERAGWQPGEHRDRRTGARYLLASPRRI